MHSVALPLDWWALVPVDVRKMFASIVSDSTSLHLENFIWWPHTRCDKMTIDIVQMSVECGTKIDTKKTTVGKVAIGCIAVNGYRCHWMPFLCVCARILYANTSVSTVLAICIVHDTYCMSVCLQFGQFHCRFQSVFFCSLMAHAVFDYSLCWNQYSLCDSSHSKWFLSPLTRIRLRTIFFMLFFFSSNWPIIVNFI